ncbi:Cyclin-L1 [Amphibalanus amphitrite]|uniref:Cyclin-L1 n=1 Tax=Amphibalanus amphitrite TaxID=1232801 RepID=A0A6A4WEZ8_AMPAM|nr:Cyclin-L1 [Amphibalanus amphitrite]
MATGQVLMHRFYYSKSYVKHPMEITAMACLCLASKIEEAPRRTRDIINVFHHIKQIRAKKTISPVVLDPNYIHLKNQVIKAERRILKELGFCVHVQHPHKMIVMYLRFLRLEGNTGLLQYAWNAMNDALRTNVFVRFSPETVAAACIYLAARVKRVPMPNRPHWFTVFDMREQDLREIATAIMKLYTRAKPNAEQLERAIEELRARQQELRLKNKLLSGTNTPQGAGNFSPAVSHNNSPAEQRGASLVDSTGRETPNGAAAGSDPAADPLLPDSAKLNKENIASALAKRCDSSRSRSSNEDSDRRKLQSKSRRDRYRSHSRSPSNARRRHSSTPDRHRTKHKKDKERSRDKTRHRSVERGRSRSPLRSKSKHSSQSVGKRDRRGSPQQDRHKSSKKRSYDSNHKRR